MFEPLSLIEILIQMTCQFTNIQCSCTNWPVMINHIDIHIYKFVNIYNRLSNFIIKHKIINKNQYGFKINLWTYNDINDVEFDFNIPAIAYSVSIIIIIVF